MNEERSFWKKRQFTTFLAKNTTSSEKSIFLTPLLKNTFISSSTFPRALLTYAFPVYTAHNIEFRDFSGFTV